LAHDDAAPRHRPRGTGLVGFATVGSSIVGIDLGTSNSVVAAATPPASRGCWPMTSGAKIHPSVVSFHPNGSVVIGAEAKQRKVLDPRNTVYSAKRLIGRTFRSPQVQTAQARMPYQIKEGPNQQPLIVTRAGEFSIPEISAMILDRMHTIAREALQTDELAAR
jgi:molecular chaperone DnaK